MKIVLATPLYPPDIAEPAVYSKELAKRLALVHDVTIVTYGSLPEQIPGVRIVAINKRQPLLIRLFVYLIALIKAVRSADLIYMQNGPSVELPIAITQVFMRRPLVIHLGDNVARKFAAHHPMRTALEKFVIQRGSAVIENAPSPKPEILPFSAPPTIALEQWEESWTTHLQQLNNVFAYAT